MAVVYTRTHKHGIELPWKRAFHHEYHVRQLTLVYAFLIHGI